MAAPAAPITDEWARARRDAQIHALLVKFRGDVDRVTQIGEYTVMFTRRDVLRVRRDYPPDVPPTVVPGPRSPGRPRADADPDDPPPPRRPISSQSWPEPRPEAPPVILEEPVQQVPTGPPPLPEVRSVPVSPMQDTVIRLMCQGMTNREIADELRLSEDTIKTHVRRIFASFGGVRDRMALVIQVLTCVARPVVLDRRSTPEPEEPEERGPAPLTVRDYARDAEPEPVAEPEPEPAPELSIPEVLAEPTPAAKSPKGVIAHGEPRGYFAHNRLKVPIDDEDSCGCRAAGRQYFRDRAAAKR